jgi:outer membrane lipoprotein-sorting protein
MVSLHSDLEKMKAETFNIRHPTSNIQRKHKWPAIECWMLNVGCGLFFFCFGADIFAANTNLLLANWLNSQTNIQTWSADLVQTRALKSLTQPLTAAGHLWFAEPDRFRWELGNPPQTIAIRQADEMRVIYPQLKRAEVYALDGRQAGPWRDALALLQAGFPRNQAELESQFRVLTETITNQTCEVALQPKSAAARRLMPQIKIAFRTNDFSLCATELQFADGSTMRNDFTNAILNVPLAGALFAPELGSDFKIIEPLKKNP